MRNLLLFVCIASITLSCRDDESSPDGETTEFNFYPNATLTQDYPYVVDGNSLVFERYFERDDEPLIADDEYSDQFFFEVTPDGESFLLEGESLRTANTLFNVFCFCAPSDVFEITDGFISGEEIGGIWRISVDISYSRGVRDPQTGEVREVHSDVLTFEGLHMAENKPGN